MTVKITTEVPEVIEGWVWCEWEGDLHEEIADPHNYGPRYPEDVDTEDGWEVRTDPQYSGELAFYTCPGEHRPVFYVRKETP